MTHADRLKRGTNFGLWLSQADLTDAERLATRITRDDFARMASIGADHVRLPIDYELIESPEPPYGLIEDGMAHVDRAIAWARQTGLRLNLDLHKTPGMSFFTPEANDIWTRGDLQDRFANIWRQIAARYLGPDYDHVSFELLNEPTAADPADWNRLAHIGLDAVRQVDTDRVVVIGSNSWQSPLTFPDLDDFGDPGVIYSLHFYEPFVFTHQKAPWVPHLVQLDLTVEYPSLIPDLTAAAAAIDDESAREQTMIYSGVTLDADRLAATLAPALEFAARTGAPLYCSEFGTWAPAPVESQKRWFRDVTDLFARHGIGWSQWVYSNLFDASGAAGPGVKVLFPDAPTGA